MEKPEKKVKFEISQNPCRSQVNVYQFATCVKSCQNFSRPTGVYDHFFHVFTHVKFHHLTAMRMVVKKKFVTSPQVSELPCFRLTFLMKFSYSLGKVKVAPTVLNFQILQERAVLIGNLEMGENFTLKHSFSPTSISKNWKIGDLRGHTF